VGAPRMGVRPVNGERLADRGDATWGGAARGVPPCEGGALCREDIA